MVTTPDEQRAEQDLERRNRNAFNIGLLITVASVLVIVSTLIMQTVLGENYYVPITGFGLAGGVIGMVLARREKAYFSATVLVASLFTIASFYVFTFETTATMMTVIMIILALGIVVQTVPAEKTGRSVVIVVLVGVSLIIADTLWPIPRIEPPPYTEIVITAAGLLTIVIMVIIVIKQFSSFSLRSKLIGATLAVALLAVAVVSIGVNVFTTQAITTQVGANLKTLTESQSVAIGEFLSRKVNTLEALSSSQILIESAQEKNSSYADSDDSPSKQIAIASAQWPRTTEEDEIVKNVLESDAAAELNRFQILFPDNLQILVTDKYGAQIGATQRTRDYYKGDEAWWQDTYVNGFGSVYVGQPEFNSESRTYSVIIAVPIHAKKDDGGGEIVGILQTIISLDALGNNLLNSRFGESGVIEILIDEYNYLFVDDEGEINIVESYLDPETLAYIQQPDEDFIITEFDDIAHFLSSGLMDTLTLEPAVSQLGWTVIATQHADEILAPVDQQQSINTILGIIVVVSAGIVAAYVGQRISQPITNLTNVAQEVASGNLDIQAPIETEDEIGTLAASFNVMTGQLRDSIMTLEQRVQNRTQALATTVEVGRQLSTILDEDELLTAVVNQVRDSFDYYHAHIYLLENDGKTLTMASGTGEAGQQMIAAGHQIKVGAGLVGQAAKTNQVILVSDVTEDEAWLPNPLLPDTKSETAVPIAIGNDILGVLDVQHNIINGLQQEDTDLLQSVANQVAVALRNARLYKETSQQALSEAQLRTINQKITNTTDMETAMKVAIRELGEALGTGKATIRLGHHQPPDPQHTTNGKNNDDNT